MHALLSNIELRTMNEENNPGAVMENSRKWSGTGKKRIEEENLLIKRVKLVTMMRVEGYKMKTQ